MIPRKVPMSRYTQPQAYIDTLEDQLLMSR